MRFSIKIYRQVLTAFITVLLLTNSQSNFAGMTEGYDEDATLDEYTQFILEKTIIPEYDPYEIVSKYTGIEVNADVLKKEKREYSVNDNRLFNVLNVTTNEYSEVQATLAYETDHLYFWIQDGVEYDPDALKLLCDTFEYQIYPSNRLYFGEEASPGVDNDEHLFVLYTQGMGAAAGYFSAADSFPSEVEEFSNESEIFMLSAVYTHLDHEYTYGVLAHEFQHMIHWNLDKNESTWVNEGFSELAVLLNGYDVGGFDRVFAGNPDLQLNHWPRQEVASTHPHYGAAFLFMTYFYDQFGSEATNALVNHPENGFESIDAVLEDNMNEAGNLNGDEVFQNWTIANYLQDKTLAEGQYGYSSVDDIPKFRSTVTLDCSDATSGDFTVQQYGTDYITIECDEPFILTVEGTPIVPVLPIDPYSEDFFFWSNKGDQSVMKLTQEFDFREVDGQILFEYYTWYDIETDWDYLYLMASVDGDNWENIITPGCTSEDLTGSNHGCGYNGSSEGWVKEVVNLSEYAGKKVTLQFEYVTDMALNGEGLVLDDMKIDAIQYTADFEENSGGWIAEGFARVANALPQSYRLASIFQSEQGIVIEKQVLNEEQAFSMAIDPTMQGQLTLVISGTSRFTNMPALYSVSIREQD